MRDVKDINEDKKTRKKYIKKNALTDEVLNKDEELQEIEFNPETDIIMSNKDFSENARKIFTMMAKKGMGYALDDKLVKIDIDKNGNGYLKHIKPDLFRTFVEKVAVLKYEPNGKRKQMTNDAATVYLASEEVSTCLKHITNIYNSPVLILDEENNELITLTQGYHEVNGGWYVCNGEDVPVVPFEEAKEVIWDVTSEFRWVTEADRARYLGAYFTPAMKWAGFIKGRVPMTEMDADQPQAGKGYALDIITATYDEQSNFTSITKGGVGSLDELFQVQLSKGQPFIQLDNLRERVNSQFIEMFITATSSNSVTIRIPHIGNMEVDPNSYIILATSNGMKATTDLSLRTNICEMLKQPEGYKFKDRSPDFDLVARIHRLHLYYLGCIHSCIRHWWKSGRKIWSLPRHDFREWVSVIGGLIHFTWPELPQIMEGHKELQEKVAKPALAWMGEVCKAVEEADQLYKPLFAAEIVDICQEGDVDIPGVSDSDDSDIINQKTGRLLKSLFGKNERYVDKTYYVDRIREKDDFGRMKKKYVFNRLDVE